MEDGMSKRMYMHMYDWVTILYSRTWHNFVNRLYFTLKIMLARTLKLFLPELHYKKWPVLLRETQFSFRHSFLGSFLNGLEANAFLCPPLLVWSSPNPTVPAPHRLPQILKKVWCNWMTSCLNQRLRGRKGALWMVVLGVRNKVVQGRKGEWSF